MVALNDGDRMAKILTPAIQEKGYRIALRITVSAFDAEDVLQESNCKALSGLQGLAVDVPTVPWFFTIIHHQAINLVRRRDRQRAVDIGAGPEPAARVVEVLGESTELRDAIASAISALPSRERDVISRVYSGMDCAEIASQLGLQVGTVYNIAWKARSALHAALQDWADWALNS